ncbi:hypothetical protein FOA52_015064 [Chlamydomonas sp. UWO 241]|nr:hypothetical protein FOA52_015064 [Chlamydomonas sp. UWO 241]
MQTHGAGGQQQQQQQQLWGLATDLAANPGAAQGSHGDGGQLQGGAPASAFPGFGAQPSAHAQPTVRPAGSQQPGGGAPPGQAAFGLSRAGPLLPPHAPAPSQPLSRERAANGPPVQPYGLALELQGDPASAAFPDDVHQPATAPPGQPLRQPGARRALGDQLQGAGWADASAVVQANAASVGAGRPPRAVPTPSRADHYDEPDYGIVEELKSPGPPEPGSKDFGLAAEVARRHGPRGSGIGRFGGTDDASLAELAAGSAASLRPRRRLAQPGPAPATFGMTLGDELAAGDPFSAANRAMQQSQYVKESDGVKFPELPGSAPSPAPPAAPTQRPGSAASASDGALAQPIFFNDMDGQQADGSCSGRDQSGFGPSLDELRAPAGQPGGEEEAAAWAAMQASGMYAGSEPSRAETERRMLDALEWEPPGDKYEYNRDTGVLEIKTEHDGGGPRLAREFIEDVATGDFYKLDDPGLLRKLGKLFAKHQVNDDDEEELGLQGQLQAAAVQCTHWMSSIGIFVQGLLAGFSLIMIMVPYVLYDPALGNWSALMQYYAPASMTFSRTYFNLSALAALAAAARYFQDSLRSFRPRILGLWFVDVLQFIAYAVAYLITTIATSFEADLSFSYDRDPNFYELSVTSDFLTSFKNWRLQNTLRCLCVCIGFILSCYQISPVVYDQTIKYDVKFGMRAVRETTAKLPKTLFTNPVAQQAPKGSPMARRCGGSPPTGAGAAPMASPAGVHASQPLMDGVTAVSSGMNAHATYSVRRTRGTRSNDTTPREQT